LARRKHTKKFAKKPLTKFHGRNWEFCYKIIWRFPFQEALFYEENKEAFCISVFHLFSPSIFIPHASLGVLPFNASCGLM
jgi:hypothetical protein